MGSASQIRANQIKMRNLVRLMHKRFQRILCHYLNHIPFGKTDPSTVCWERKIEFHMNRVQSHQHIEATIRIFSLNTAENGWMHEKRIALDSRHDLCESGGYVLMFVLMQISLRWIFAFVAVPLCVQWVPGGFWIWFNRRIVVRAVLFCARLVRCYFLLFYVLIQGWIWTGEKQYF